MSVGMVLGVDDYVAEWAFRTYQRVPTPYQSAVGLVDPSKKPRIVGAALFQNYNGANVELSYYGRATLTPGIVRALARLVLVQFDPARVTVCVNKNNRRLAQALQKKSLGFRLEGAQRCYYGKQDTAANTALRFVMFRDQVERVAKIPK